MAAVPGTAKIFISYRRDDSAPYAGRLYDRLADAIGQENIFMDVDSISLGLDFAEAIRNAVSSCDVLLAIIGPEWITAERGGRLRLEDPEDFVRLEIETALERNVRVVPILVDEAELPAREQLPESLQPLVRRQTLSLTHAQFRIEAQRLIDDIGRIFAAQSPATAPPSASAMAPPLPHSEATGSVATPVDEPATTPALPQQQPAPEPASTSTSTSTGTATTTPPVEAGSAAGATASVVLAEANHVTLALQLAGPHVIDIDNSGFFGLIKVDGKQVVKKVNPEGVHALVIDDLGTPVTVTLSFGTTWTANLKDVVLQVGDEVVYRG